MEQTPNIQFLQHQTMDWLKRSKKPSTVTLMEVEELRHLLRFHENRYYVQNDPLISDGEYDQLFNLLKEIENIHPEWITKDSPTQRVGVTVIDHFPKVNHLVPMLSLQNGYQEEDVMEWDRKLRDLFRTNVIEYCVEPKFDGASISLVYTNNQLERGATRGDGVVGDDITPNIKRIRTVPLSAHFDQYHLQQVEIRGEVLMRKNVFDEYNQQLIAAGEAPLANPRNAAAGTLRMKDPQVVADRNLEAFVYHISYVQNDGEVHPYMAKHSDQLRMLWEAGFRSPVQEMRVVQGIDEVLAVLREYEEKRDTLPYEIDGMVIKVNSIEWQERAGMTAHHPRWAMAFKFKARQATSKLLDVTFQVGRTGAVTPVAKIQPVQVGGVVVSSISIHNEDYIKEKDLMIGDTILIERSGDVIPQVVKSFAELRDGSQTPIQFPINCPSCGDALYKPQEESVWRCVNAQCEAQVVERLIHFVGKDTMDIRFLGEQNIRRMYALGLLTTIPGLYHLDYTAIQGLEGMGAKSVQKLREAIEQSKQQPLHRLIYALGIRYVGENTAKTLARNIQDLRELKNFTEEQLRQMEDIGVKVAGSIVQFFRNPDNLHMIDQLAAAGVMMQRQEEPKGDGSLSGKTFLFTGTLAQMKRSEAEAMVESRGGSILSGVSAKLNYLVVGEDAGSKLEKAKKLNTVRILTENEFLQLINS
jgi:DNA ligase (NAD+)